MADLNALIAQGYQFQAPPDPFVQYGKMQQLQQGEQANQLNQMKMQEAQAAAAERNALRQFLPSLNESNRSQLLGYGAAGQNIFKTMAEGDTQQRLTAQAKSQAELNKSNILKNVVAQTRDAVAGIDPNDAPSYLTLRTSVLSQYPDLEPYMPPAWDANVKQRLIDTAASVLERQKPEPGFTLSAGQVRYPAGYTGVATAPTAADKPPEKLEIMRALGYSMDAAGDAAYEAAKRAAPTVAAPSVEISTMNALGIPVTPDGFAYFQQLKTKPVVAAEPTTNEIKNARAIALGVGPEGSPAYSREFGRQLARLTAKSEGGGGGGGGAAKAPVGFRFTPSGDLEAIPGGPSAAGLTTKEIQKREAVLPQARQAVKTVSNTMSVIGQTVDKLLANPDGINGITGLIGGVTPALTDKARTAKADLEQLKNLAFIQGITELRAASKTGAAVGNVTNREGDRFENLKASLDRSQSKDDLITALKKLKQQADLTSQFMTDAFDETYSYKSAAPSPAGGGALSPAEEAELAQLRKRFGK